jgi:serine phosphatase RsbU (regulator of sigma subunit)
MKWTSIILSFIGVLFTSNIIFASPQKGVDLKIIIDSLEQVAETASHDTDKVAALIAWDDLIYISDPSLDLILNTRISKICLNNLKQNIPVNERYIFENHLCFVLQNIGILYHQKGKHDKSIDFFMRALKISEKIKDLDAKANILNSVGSVYKDLDENTVAIEYFNKSYSLYSKLEDLSGASSPLNNLGVIYRQSGDYNKALEFYLKSLDLKIKSNDLSGQATTLSNIGMCYSYLGDEAKTLKYCNESLEICRKIKDKAGESGTLNHLGTFYKNSKDYNKAIEYSSKALEIAKTLKIPFAIRNSSKVLFDSYSGINDYKNALDMHVLYTSISDTIKRIENQKEVIKQEYKKSYEKQKATDDILNAQKVLIEQRAKEEQKLITYVVIIGLILVIAFLIFVFNRLKITRKQKGIIEIAHQQVEEKNQEITDSIKYAKRIQSAILPPSKLVKKHFPQSFILYKPKDIVAGDFYWLEHKADRVLLAAADCTGHGVPGAMVSVVCNNGLNRSVREYNLADPGKILDKTREIVVQEFEMSEEEVSDGMDIALCSLSTGNLSNGACRELKYAGAHNPLWIIRKGAEEVEEIKADKQPIGKFDNFQPYATHTIKLNEGDTFYLFSDGYADQYGGPKGKKLKQRSFKEYLLSINNKKMDEQHQLLEDFFSSWRGALDQIDDVCIIGVKI